MKDWAEKSNAIMEIHEERELVYTVILTSIYGFTMDSKEIWLKTDIGGCRQYFL
ncbi:MAG: hypothetical protein ACLR0U_28355 [Enterocloster clostridioformis]